jgi:hypothetical protein
VGIGCAEARSASFVWKLLISIKEYNNAIELFGKLDPDENYNYKQGR